VKLSVRKLLTFVEGDNSRAGSTGRATVRRACAAAVIENPYAGRYVEDLSALSDMSVELGAVLIGPRRRGAGVPRRQVESYGKAAWSAPTANWSMRRRLLHPESSAGRSARRWARELR
jgi:hypothetical protein